MASLMRAKFILVNVLREAIERARQAEQKKAHQLFLVGPASKAEISFEHAFVFREGMFANQRRYRGSWRPAKHFLGADNVPAFDGTDKPEAEERQCAEALDSLPALRFWIRNVARHPEAFWLPLAHGRFYPDFVAELDDGRILVVEYKGAHLAQAGNDDTNEKRAVGRLWEVKCGGKGLFLMVEKDVGGRSMREQMLAKIG
jgi:type III restriction enzyme